MLIKELTDKLKTYPQWMKVYTQKTEYFGNVAYVFTVCEIMHPLINVPCLLLTDDYEKIDLPVCSDWEKTVNVGELIAELGKYDSSLEVMTKPVGFYRDFNVIYKTELSSYGFIGQDIPCVLLIG